MKNKQGQGVVESVFAVGILALLLTGAVILVMLGANNRRTSFDRRKATELATLVTEELVTQSQSNPEVFWTLTDIPKQSKANFEGYTYLVDFRNISNNPTYPACGVGRTDCAEIVIGIGWSGKDEQSLNFNRFFSKNE